jgi:thiamine-phosphate pyrophosphorylase
MTSLPPAEKHRLAERARSLASAAQRLNAERGRYGGASDGLSRLFLPSLFVFSDTQRLADPEGVAETLPAGTGIILRHYDVAREERRRLAHRLGVIARSRGLIFLVGADVALARESGALGVHLPEKLLRRPALWRLQAGSGNFLVTAAVHNLAAMHRAESLRVDALFLSPVFATASHPDTPALGHLLFRRWLGETNRPVYALGGITEKSLRLLNNSGACGAGVIGALKE